MDASQRWETEALRSGSHSRKTPPRPSAKQQHQQTEAHDPDAAWMTLKEAEAVTGIPVNTLRKWSRKSSIPSYLESDGDLSLRMVDLDAVIAHAHQLGRDVTPISEEEAAEMRVGESESGEADEAVDVEPIPDEVPEDDATYDTVDEFVSEDEIEPKDAGITADVDIDESEDPGPPAPPEGTLIVPLDAWNKMLNQLGNLHEAGQQLAEARERAAKAETEAVFLRERLAEMRAQSEEATADDPSDGPPFKGDGRGAPATMQGDASEERAQQGDNAKPTTSYWRYLTFGWRDRKRRFSKRESA